MQAVTMTLCTPIRVNRPVASPSRTAFPQRAAPKRGLFVRNALIGDVNDPEKSKENVDKKKQASEWSPVGNKNPLEKKTVAHGGQEGAPEANEAVDKIKETIDKAKDAVKDATS